MFEKARSGRDAFAFSLRGMRTIAAFAPATAVADDRMNRIIAERLSRTPDDQPGMTREIEDFLARYFAPACRQAA